MYLRRFIRSKSDPLVETAKLTNVISENVVQVNYPSRRESTVSARNLDTSSECYSDSTLVEQQAVFSEETKSKSNP